MTGEVRTLAHPAAAHPAAAHARAALCAVFALILAACVSPGQAPPAAGPSAPADAAVRPPADVAGRIVGRNDRLLMYAPAPGETLAAVAERLLGSAQRQWEIEQLGGTGAGRILAVPLRPLNPVGVTVDGVQTVPILTYHRIGRSPTRMTIAPDGLAEQFEYLRAHGYHVVRLSEFAEFLEGRKALPPRSVVITFDDGHVSTYEYAYPLLQRFGFPATFFLYTDFVGSRDALKWPQIREMAASGLVDFQAHSRTHSNMTQRAPGESDHAFVERIDSELRQPRDLIQRQLGTTVAHFAYPYGDANDLVIERIAAARYTLGLTVNSGPNPFYAFGYALRRTMIYGGQDLATFRAALQVHRAVDLR